MKSLRLNASIGKLVACAVVALGIAPVVASSAHANTSIVTLQNTYWGGDNTYDPSDGNSIGGSPFTISSLTAQRVGPNDDTLQIVINTAYAGQAGTDGTGYGDLFITPGANAWHPSGTAPNYGTDTYKVGEWADAFTIPTNPSGNSGTGDLYSTLGGGLAGGNGLGSGPGVVLSNVAGSGCTNTYPVDPTCPWYYRADQAVDYNPVANQAILATGSWSVNAAKDTITFDIVDDGLLGNNFAIAWAMTCANDVIQGQVTGVPEPATWAMMLIGMGFIGWRMRRVRAVAARA